MVNKGNELEKYENQSMEVHSNQQRMFEAVNYLDLAVFTMIVFL